MHDPSRLSISFCLFRLSLSIAFLLCTHDNVFSDNLMHYVGYGMWNMEYIYSAYFMLLVVHWYSLIMFLALDKNFVAEYDVRHNCNITSVKALKHGRKHETRTW